MSFGDFWARLGGRGGGEDAKAAERLILPAPPTADDLRAALDRTDESMAGGAVPSVVVARVHRITAAVRDTLPRLDALGAGSPVAYSVMATATDYLPGAVGGYLRLPRRFADTRPVDGGKTSLMVLVDQLDLLGRTMDEVFDAVYRDDAIALVAHGRFLAEKFGPPSTPALTVGADIPTPALPESAEAPAQGEDPGLAHPADPAAPDPAPQPARDPRPAPDQTPEPAPDPTPEPAPETNRSSNPLDLEAPLGPAPASSEESDSSRGATGEPRITPLRPPDPA